jgi:hypothetical protein
MNLKKSNKLFTEILAFKRVFISGIRPELQAHNNRYLHLGIPFCEAGVGGSDSCSAKPGPPTDAIDSKSSRVGLSVRASNFQDLTRLQISLPFQRSLEHCSNKSSALNDI